MLDAAFWRNRRVLVTGHTGFKGAWLTLWLGQLGARVAGLALPPEPGPALYHLAGLTLEREVLADLRAPDPVREMVDSWRPEVVLHLAAQSLVRESYLSPVDTFATNVMGTANVLEAVRAAGSECAVVVVTTDKVYENLERGQPFEEDDRLGGHDPYSASKACAELVTASYRRSFFGAANPVRVATARAGNVIGGGDWAKDRIIPDLVRAVEAGAPARLRNPDSVRPWQHVLEPLLGYLMMAQWLAGDGAGIEALNFAPAPGSVKTVAELVDEFSRCFGGRPGWVREPGKHPKEAKLLTLAADRAERVLGWRPLLDFPETVEWTAAWYRAHRSGADMRRLTLDQIDSYSARTDVTAALPPSAARAEPCLS